jgi:hypothetical protein
MTTEGKHTATAPTIEIESDGIDIFVVFDGVKIAKRGHPNTPQACTWVPLEAGYAVYSNHDHSQITIEKNGVWVN